MKRQFIVLIFCLCWFSFKAKCQDINTIMMKSTFFIEGPTKTKGYVNQGTCFMVWYPPKSDTTSTKFAIITAAHVLDSIVGDTATLLLRKEIEANKFEPFTHKIAIRNNGRNLYYVEPGHDICVMNFNLLPEMYMRCFGYQMLASESMLDDVNIYPGNELFCLGYSLGLRLNYSGFPILRSGRIASYPIIPTTLYPQFLFEAHIYQGNSGGPVFYTSFGHFNRDNTVNNSGYQFIIGLISKTYVPGSDNFEMSIVEPATYIRKAIEHLIETN